VGISREATRVNLEELKALLQLLDDKDITEFELENEGMKLRVRKAGAAAPAPTPTMLAPVMPAMMPGGGYAVSVPPAPTSTSASAEPAAAPAAAPEDDAVVVKSPIVGTFYRSPAPGAAMFVNVGDQVKVGQVLCIIEAMKLMNEIEAELAGEIVKIHHENGQPVQYGEPLFSIRPA
jgi:acetyl-CoA carboxylase biotin carboxyl carrier protein